MRLIFSDSKLGRNLSGVLAMDRQEIGIDMETADRCMERENTGQLSEVGILGR